MYTHIQRFRNVENERMKKGYSRLNKNSKKSGIAILIANKITIEITKDKEGHMLTDRERCLP